MSLKSYILLAVLMIATPVAAHNGAMGIVKERMDGMLALGKAMEELTALSKETIVNRVAVAAQSEIIVAHSGDLMLNRFPVGSLSKASEARGTIWQNWEKFSSIAYELEDHAIGLSDKNTPMLLQNSLTLIGQTCSGCHKNFRIKKN